MSVIGTKPFARKIVDSLDEAELADLADIVNDPGEPEDIRLYGTQNVLSDANEGVSYARIALEPTTGFAETGILCYHDSDNCGFFAYSKGMPGMTIYEIDPVARSYRVVQEHLTAEELRRMIGDASQSGGSSDPWVQSAKDRIDIGETSTDIDSNVKVKGALETDGSVKIGKAGDGYKIILNGVELELPATYVPLTLTGAAKVYTSSEAFDGPVHVFIEIDTATTHSSLGLDINTYDAVESFSAGRVLMSGQFYDMFAYLDDEGHVVINLSTLGDITDVHARAVLI